MVVPQTVEYALRAVLHIAQAPGDEPVRVSDIAQALDVPRNYLSKTLHLLARAGVLTSARGPTGGFQLATRPERLTLAAIAAPFMAVGERSCLLGRSACRDDRPCAAHDRWKLVVQQTETFFSRTTVADLLEPDAGSPPGGAGRRRRTRAAP